VVSRSSHCIGPGTANHPAKFPAELTQYAGQQVDNGDKARVYANDFISKHLQGVAGGKTYSQVSSAASAVNAQIALTPKTDPGLNSWGWWTVGVYTTYAAAGLMIAAFALLGAVVFELLIAGRKPKAITVVQKIAA
jgi:hypothetical protein